MAVVGLYTAARAARVPRYFALYLAVESHNAFSSGGVERGRERAVNRRMAGIMEALRLGHYMQLVYQ